MKIINVFEFYEKYVKRIYSEIEAKRNILPVELLFETYASFDHLKRFYLDGEKEDISSAKSLSHLKRGVLDAYKLKLKYFNQDIEEFKKLNTDFTLIDNGKFLADFTKNKNQIYKVAKEARLVERKILIEESFEKWFEVSLMIDEFEDDFFNQLDKVEWAQQKKFQWINNDIIRGFIVGIISGVISSYLIFWLTK